MIGTMSANAIPREARSGESVFANKSEIRNITTSVQTLKNANT
jgi:hypothetical protein